MTRFAETSHAIYLIILYFHINCMAVPHETGGPRTALWSVSLGCSNWAFTKAQKTTKWRNDTKWYNVPQLGFCCYVCFHFTVIRNNQLAMIKIPQFFQLKKLPIFSEVLNHLSKLTNRSTTWPNSCRWFPDFQTSEACMSWYYKLQMCLVVCFMINTSRISFHTKIKWKHFFQKASLPTAWVLMGM